MQENKNADNIEVKHEEIRRTKTKHKKNNKTNTKRVQIKKQ